MQLKKVQQILSFFFTKCIQKITVLSSTLSNLFYPNIDCASMRKFKLGDIISCIQLQQGKRVVSFWGGKVHAHPLAPSRIIAVFWFLM